MISHHHARSGRTPSARERGAALVELAFVALFIMTLAAGAYDYGMAWRVGLVTNEAARTAARTGSALDNSPQADYYALSGAKAALENSNRLQDVQRVVIYKATTTDGNVPSVCTTATSTTQLCNIITGAQFRAMTAASFDSTTGCFTAATVKNWCPSSRNNVQLTSDYYGVWIQVRYNSVFRLINSGATANRDAVMRLEPDVS